MERDREYNLLTLGEELFKLYGEIRSTYPYIDIEKTGRLMRIIRGAAFSIYQSCKGRSDAQQVMDKFFEIIRRYCKDSKEFELVRAVAYGIADIALDDSINCEDKRKILDIYSDEDVKSTISILSEYNSTVMKGFILTLVETFKLSKTFEIPKKIAEIVRKYLDIPKLAEIIIYRFSSYTSIDEIKFGISIYENAKNIKELWRNVYERDGEKTAFTVILNLGDRKLFENLLEKNFKG